MEKITKKEIDEIIDLDAECKLQETIASDLLTMAKKHDGRKELKVDRGDGKKDKVAQNVLWYEVFQLGRSCPAGKVLEKAHPRIFAAYTKQDKVAVELKKRVAETLGVDIKNMRISDYLRLTEAIVDIKLAEKK